MNIFYACVSFSAAFLIFSVTPRGKRFLKWLIHGPVVNTRLYSQGVAKEYGDGFVEYETSDGRIIDIMESLYESERQWQLCGTRYGENGTVAVFGGTYKEMLKHVEIHCGTLTFVDVLTGLVHYRAFQ